MFVSIYKFIDECQGKASKTTGVYRGASANSGMENEDKKGELSKNEQVTVVASCDNFYLFRTNDGTVYADNYNTGFAKKSDIDILVSKVKINEEDTAIKIGNSTEYSATVTPSIASDKSVSWSTSDNKTTPLQLWDSVINITELKWMISPCIQMEAVMSIVLC